MTTNDTDPRAVELSLTVRAFHDVMMRWEIDAKSMRRLLMPYEKMPDSSDGQYQSRASIYETRMRHILELDRAAAALLGSRVELAAWIRAPNAALAGGSPLQAIEAEPVALRLILSALRRELVDTGLAQ